MSVFVTVYLALALIQGEAKFGVFMDKDTCEQSVEQARGKGVQVTDCIAVDLPRPQIRG